MANRRRFIEEKVRSTEVALGYINVEAAAREAGTPPSTLRYDLKKVKEALPKVLVNQRPGPRPRNNPEEATVATSPSEKPTVCPECGGRSPKTERTGC